MKYLKAAGLPLVSVLVMGVALAGNASASALLWLLCLENNSGNLTKYLNNQCTEAAAGGHWQSLGLPTGGSDTVRILSFSLLFIDLGTGQSLHCPDVGPGWGLIENPNKLVIKEVAYKAPEAEGCKLVGEFITCKAGHLEAISGVDLPWTSEEFETEGKYFASIVGTGGNPGWAVKCGGVTDTCTESTKDPEVAELASGVTKGVLLVLYRYARRNKENCSIGGNEEGEIKGLDAILLWKGNGLSLTTL